MIADIVGTQIFTEVGSISSAGINIGFQNIKLNNEGISKFISGFIKLGNTVNTESVFISDPAADKCTNNSKSTGNEYKFIGTKIQFWLSLLMGGIGGLIIGGSILHLVFYFRSKCFNHRYREW